MHAHRRHSINRFWDSRINQNFHFANQHKNIQQRFEIARSPQFKQTKNTSQRDIFKIEWIFFSISFGFVHLIIKDNGTSSTFVYSNIKPGSTIPILILN